MEKVTVRTNYHRRDVIRWWNLTEVEQKEFDWIEDSETGDPDYEEFVRYRGNVYCVSEFMRLPFRDLFPQLNLEGEPTSWDGYQSDSFFSGVLVKLVDDGEGAIMATYYS